MSLKNDNPKKEAPKKEAYPEWPGTEDAELGVKYKNAKGNIIQKGQSK
tara:strand:- start:4925 stop:5068 length:144 start_codon:yes stop_codon:yes gene_type:complete